MTYQILHLRLLKTTSFFQTAAVKISAFEQNFHHVGNCNKYHVFQVIKNTTICKFLKDFINNENKVCKAVFHICKPIFHSSDQG